MLDWVLGAAELERRAEDLAEACGVAADLAKDGLARLAAGR
jgi:hypothetical protein